MFIAHATVSKYQGKAPCSANSSYSYLNEKEQGKKQNKVFVSFRTYLHTLYIGRHIMITNFEEGFRQ